MEIMKTHVYSSLKKTDERNRFEKAQRKSKGFHSARRLSAAPIVLRGGEKTVTFVCMQTKKVECVSERGKKRERT